MRTVDTIADTWNNMLKSYEGFLSPHLRSNKNIHDSVRYAPYNNTLDKYIDMEYRTREFIKDRVAIFNYVCILNVRKKFKISGDCFAENILKRYFEFVDTKLYECYYEVQKQFIATNMAVLVDLRMYDIVLSREFYIKIFKNSQIVELDSNCDNKYIIVELNNDNGVMNLYNPQEETKFKSMKQYRFLKCNKVCKKIIKYEYTNYPHSLDGQKQTVQGQLNKKHITSVLLLPNIEECDTPAFSCIMSRNLNLFANFQTIESFRNTKWIKQKLFE